MSSNGGTTSEETGHYPPVEIIGASKLIDLYGYWISFHDASVERITIDRIGPTVTVEFLTNDVICRDGVMDEMSNQDARIVLRWLEVEELNLERIGLEKRNWINGLDFAKREDRIETKIELMDALQGSIIARSVEVCDVEPLSD